jgi:hypothetical protein
VEWTVEWPEWRGQWSGRSGEGEAEEWSGGRRPADAMRRRRAAAQAREREGLREGANALGFGDGRGARPGRGLYAGAAAPHPTAGRRPRGGGVGFWWAGPLSAAMGPLSGCQFSGRASGRPAVLGLRPKH